MPFAYLEYTQGGRFFERVGAKLAAEVHQGAKKAIEFMATLAGHCPFTKNSQELEKNVSINRKL